MTADIKRAAYDEAKNIIGKAYNEATTLVTGFTLHNNAVWYKPGTIASNKIAAFDLENTLIWSDSGLIYMRTAEDWVPTTNVDVLAKLLTQLITDRWTIVIFTNQQENDPLYTATSLARINNFLTRVNRLLPQGTSFAPFVYVAIRNDNNRKPNNGMWSLFMQQAQLTTISPASFYCGDAIGPTETNPLYRWSNHDTEFARACNLTIYNPSEILGTYTPNINILIYRVLFIIAADESQYRDFVNSLPVQYKKVKTLTDVTPTIAAGFSPVVTGERFATTAGRARVRHFLEAALLNNSAFLLFTRPVKPFATNYNKVANVITGYANVLDVHLNADDSAPMNIGTQIVPIIRMN